MRPISEGGAAAAALGSLSEFLAWSPRQLWSRLEGMGAHRVYRLWALGSFCLSLVVQRTPVTKVLLAFSSQVSQTQDARRGFAFCS